METEMEIEEGKLYRTRSGAKVLVKSTKISNEELSSVDLLHIKLYPIKGKIYNADGTLPQNHWWWREDGSFAGGMEHDADIIGLWDE